MKILVLDIGGTAIKVGIYENGHLHNVRERATEAQMGGTHVIHNVEALIREYQSSNPIDRIGISTAGQVNPKEGCITYANSNIPGYTGMPIKKILEQSSHIPVLVENDVKCAALAEAYFGSGKGIRDFVCLTFGTGIGGAIILNGRLYSGANDSAGQFGALITHPEDSGKSGDFYAGGYEKYASVSALVREARAYDPSLTSGKRVFQAFEKEPVRRIVDAWIDEIVLGLRSIVHMLNPGAVILDGGIMEQAYVTEQIKEKLLPQLMPTFRGVSVQKGMLGNRAGLYGAAALWEDGN
ncbi:MAG: ROK family protein [Faecousia sp.]